MPLTMFVVLSQVFFSVCDLKKHSDKRMDWFWLTVQVAQVP